MKTCCNKISEVFKMILVLCLLFISMQTLSVVNASEVGNTNLVEMSANQTTKEYSDINVFFADLIKASGKINIKLLSNVENIQGVIPISENQNVTVDLNGKTLSTSTKSTDVNRHHYAIDNYGHLTINDSIGTGTIRARGIENLANATMVINGGTIVNVDANGGAAVWNEGDLTINGGIFKTEYVGAPGDSSGPGCLNNSGKAIINNGRFESTSRRTYAIISTGDLTVNAKDNNDVIVMGPHGAISTDGGLLVINGGIYTSSEYYGLYASNDGRNSESLTAAATVNGGIFTGKSYSVWIGSDRDTIVDSTIKINGGTFNQPINAQANTIMPGAIVVEGGTFVSLENVVKYLSNAYKVYQVNGKYVVAPKTTGITLSSSALKLEKNSTAQLTATLAPVGTLEKVIWTTDSDKVATVDSTGKVTAKGTGTETITATADGKTASCTVSVYEIVAPVIPPVDEDTNVSLGEEAKEVLKDVVKDVIDNVKTSTSISNETREKLETALAAGKDISVAPKVEVKKESAIEKEVVTKIENAMKATTEKDKVAEVAQYYDLSMMLTAAGEPLGTVNELTGKVEFTVSIPKDLTKAGRKFYMVRVHGNGDTERIEGKLDGTDFSFETDKFSIFALVYEDDKVETPTTPEKPETPETPEKPESPAKPTTPTTPEKPGVDTGDVTNAGMLMTMLLAAGFVGFTTLKRRNRI